MMTRYLISTTVQPLCHEPCEGSRDRTACLSESIWIHTTVFALPPGRPDSLAWHN